jgi:hypothetical protein
MNTDIEMLRIIKEMSHSLNLYPFYHYQVFTTLEGFEFVGLINFWDELDSVINLGQLVNGNLMFINTS